MLESVLTLLLLLQSGSATPAKDDIGTALEHAQALYYGARFTDSIQLLVRVDDVLGKAPERLQERIDTKLQLALAHIGLNDTSAAKSFLLQMYALDSDYSLDPQQFSPKVIALARDAQAEQNKTRCQTAEQDARKHLQTGNSLALQTLVGSMRAKCSSVAALEPDAAELLYKTGLTAYKSGDFTIALQHFHGAVKLSPTHELASQYIELAQSKLQVVEERLVLSWQRNFDSHQLTQAAADYRQIASSGSKQVIARLDGEYRKALSSLVDNWNTVCVSNWDEQTISTIRSQISNLLPVPSYGQDIRAKMSSCARPLPPPPSPDLVIAAALPKIQATRAACLQMAPQSALIHLKSRVDPEIPQDARTYLKNSQVTVRVKVKIDEEGNISVLDAQGSNVILNNSVKNAVAQWRFSTVRDQDGPRCVETEFPISISIK